MGKPTVAIDVGPLGDTLTGVGRYTRELVRALPAHADLRPYVVSLRAPDVGAARWRAPARAVQLAWRRLDAPSIERLVGEVDVAHGTNFVLPATRRAAGVVTVHDLSFVRADAPRAMRRLDPAVEWSVGRARAVVVPTAAVASELGRRYRVEERRMFVTPEGVGEGFFDARPADGATLSGLGIRRPFFLAVGSAEPRKNVARLLSAWDAAGLHREGWSLVVAGRIAPRDKAAAGPGVVPTGYIGEARLSQLLAASEAFCYPSLYEGFGLPPLEAMATGTPVLAGDYAAAPEVLGDAALIVTAGDVSALTDGLRALASDEALRRRLGEAGRERARAFTWERSAALTADAYRAALA